MNITISNERDLKKLELTKRYASCQKKSAAKTLSRISGRGRKNVKAKMKDHIHKPTRFTRNSIFFQGAQAKDEFGIMSSAVFIGEQASQYLNTLVQGETITELYNRSPILVPNIRGLKRAAVKRELGVKINSFGNIVNMDSNEVERLLKNKEFVFLVNKPQPHLREGIYFRNKQRNGKGRGLFTLFTFTRSQVRKQQLPFTKLAIEPYKFFGDLYSAEMIKCLKLE